MKNKLSYKKPKIASRKMRFNYFFSSKNYSPDEEYLFLAGTQQPI